MKKILILFLISIFLFGCLETTKTDLNISKTDSKPTITDNNLPINVEIVEPKLTVPERMEQSKLFFKISNYFSQVDLTNDNLDLVSLTLLEMKDYNGDYVYKTVDQNYSSTKQLFVSILENEKKYFETKKEILVELNNLKNGTSNDFSTIESKCLVLKNIVEDYKKISVRRDVYEIISNDVETRDKESVKCSEEAFKLKALGINYFESNRIENFFKG